MRGVYKSTSTQTMSEGSSSKDTVEQTKAAPSTTEKELSPSANILSHMKTLEERIKKLTDENSRLSIAKQKEMEAIAKSMYESWVTQLDAEPKVKEDFKCSMDKFVRNAQEDNGVWQMMVAASNLHTRRSHDFDKLQAENKELRERVDGIYADSSSRTVGEKSKAEEQLSRDNVEPDNNMWDDFAKSIGTVY